MQLNKNEKKLVNGFSLCLLLNIYDYYSEKVNAKKEH